MRYTHHGIGHPTLLREMTRDCANLDPELADSPDSEDIESTGYESDPRPSEGEEGESDEDEDETNSEESEDDDNLDQWEMEDYDEEEEERLSF